MPYVSWIGVECASLGGSYRGGGAAGDEDAYSGFSSTRRPLACDLRRLKTQKSRPRIARAATAAPIPMPALAPVLRLPGDGEAVAVELVAGAAVVAGASEEVLEAIEVELAEEEEEDEVAFGFWDVTVRLDRTKRPWLLSQHGVAAVPAPVQ